MEHSTLIEEEEWEQKHAKAVYRPLHNNFLRRLFFKLTKGYASQEDMKEDFLYQKYLPTEGTVCEIGCASPERLIQKFTRRGLAPYGIEISLSGCEYSKKRFKEFGFPQNRVLHVDFFNKEFQKNFKNKFDVVYSRGFIEHFFEFEEVIKNHFNLCKGGGAVVIIIPNQRGLFYKIPLLLFNRHSFEDHNLKIMTLDNFSKLFNKPYIKTEYCNFLATINIQSAFIKRKKIGKYLQAFLDFFIFMPFLRKNDLKTQTFSPYLIFIGKKTGDIKDN